MDVTLQATITCPDYGFSTEETIPTDTCAWYWEGPQCSALVRLRMGDFCVYCSYGTVPCPPVQLSGERGCCG